MIDIHIRPISLTYPSYKSDIQIARHVARRLAFYGDTQVPGEYEIEHQNDNMKTCEAGNVVSVVSGSPGTEDF